MIDDTTTNIRFLNDAFRQTLEGGPVLVTRGIRALDPAVQCEVIRQVRQFSAFGPDNDPHGEHDFGAFNVEGQSIFWKIDYYDPSMQGGSGNPADPAVTRRVLTILLAEEY